MPSLHEHHRTVETRISSEIDIGECRPQRMQAEVHAVEPGPSRPEAASSESGDTLRECKILTERTSDLLGPESCLDTGVAVLDRL